jgi:hypothetical protein
MTRYAKILPFIFLLDACIERYDLPDNMYTATLVVSGSITNQPGPYLVQLSMSSKPDTAYTPPVNEAVVMMHDNMGQSEQLRNDGAGRYITQSIRGVVGRKYWLTISVGEEEYFTEPQELYPPGEIDKLHYAFLENAINQSDPIKPHHAIDLMIDSRGVDGYPNLFRWRLSTTHEMRTYPDLRTKELPRSCIGPPDFPCPPLIVPDVPKCAFAFANDGAACSCCRCWFTRKSELVSISNNRAVDGNVFRGTQIARVAADDYFFIRTFVEVEQLSLSEEGYKFWDLVKRQQEANGSLFQPNNFPIKGNIKSSNPDKKTPLGYFGVYGITRKSIFINPFDFPIYLEPPGIITETCAGIYPGASYEMPAFW